MKDLLFKFALICIFALSANMLLRAEDKSRTASDFLESLGSGKYAEASARIAPNIASFLTEEKIADFWAKLNSQLGKFERFGTPLPQKSTADQVFLVTAYFAKDSLNTRIMIDSLGQVSGLLFVPFSKDYAFAEPAYSDTLKFSEIELKFGSAEWLLPATLSMPKGEGNYPVVILVHGSGPQDRDETIGGYKVFRDIAHGLASRGIAVFRYEKRTKAYPQKTMKMIDKLTLKEETIDDALEAVKFLKQYEQIDKNSIFALGHSLGAYAMPLIASEAEKDLRGVILASGNARSLYELIPEQYEYIFGLDGEIDEIEKVKLDRVKMQTNLLRNRLINENTSSDSLLMGLPAHYWLDLLDYDAPQAAQKLDLPILIMQSGKDYQVTTAEFDIWKKSLAGKSNVEFELFQNLNHIYAETEGKSKPEDYLKSGNVDKEVIEFISNWVKKITKK